MKRDAYWLIHLENASCSEWRTVCTTEAFSTLLISVVSLIGLMAVLNLRSSLSFLSLMQSFSNSSSDNLPFLSLSELLNCSSRRRASQPGMSTPTCFKALRSSDNSKYPLPSKSIFCKQYYVVSTNKMSPKQNAKCQQMSTIPSRTSL